MLGKLEMVAARYGIVEFDQCVVTWFLDAKCIAKEVQFHALVSM